MGNILLKALDEREQVSSQIQGEDSVWWQQEVFRAQYQEHEERWTGLRWNSRGRPQVNKNHRPEDKSPLNLSTECIFLFEIMRERNLLHPIVTVWIPTERLWPQQTCFPFKIPTTPNRPFLALWNSATSINGVKTISIHFYHCYQGAIIYEKEPQERDPPSHLKKLLTDSKTVNVLVTLNIFFGLMKCQAYE